MVTTLTPSAARISHLSEVISKIIGVYELTTEGCDPERWSARRNGRSAVDVDL